MRKITIKGTASAFYFNYNASKHLQRKYLEMETKIHQIKIEFNVTPEVKRYVYLYLIVGSL